jgi:hypothetical protein
MSNKTSSLIFTSFFFFLSIVFFFTADRFSTFFPILKEWQLTGASFAFRGRKVGAILWSIQLSFVVC